MRRTAFKARSFLTCIHTYSTQWNQGSEGLSWGGRFVGGLQSIADRALLVWVHRRSNDRVGAVTCFFKLYHNFSSNINIPRVCSVRYRYFRYRYGCRTEITEVSGTGIDVAPNLPKCPVPVLMLYRNYQGVRYRYESLYRYRRYRYPCRTEVTEVSGTGIDVVPK